MFRTGKRLFAILMALCLVATLLPTVALSAAQPTSISTVTTEPASVKAGDSVSTVTITVDDGSFAESPQTDQFEISGAGATGVTVSSATRQSDVKQVQLSVSNCTPTQSGNLTVTVKPNAFEDTKPSGNLTKDITVDAATNPTSVTAAGTLTLGQSGKITLTITSTNSNAFVSGLSSSNITVTGATVTSYGTGNGTTTDLTVTPTLESITISVKPAAFKYQPANDVNVTGSGLTASKPTGSVSATLKNGPLTAGTQVNNQTITLTATDTLIFKTSPEKNTDISLSGDGASGLDFTVTGSDKTATLTLSGKPTKAGNITVTVKKSAFQYEPASDPAVTGTITVAAPTVSAQVSGDALTVNQAGEITITATGSDFASGLEDHPEYFTLSGGVTGQPTSVSATGNTATLTVTPTSAEAIKVATIKKEAFETQPAADLTDGSITGSVNVNAAAAPTITASYEGSALTVGEAGEIKVTASGNFAASPNANLFTLSGGGVTEPDSVKTDGKTATLTVTPKSEGTIKVTSIDKTAFNPEASDNVTPSGSAITVNAASTTTPTPTPTTEPTPTPTTEPTPTPTTEPTPTPTTEPTPTPTTEPTPTPVAPTITVETESGSSGSIATSGDDLAKAVLSAEELEAYNKGAKVVVELEETDITASVPAAEKAAVVAAAPGYTAGAFLDVSLFKQVGDGNRTSVTSTNGNIRVVLPIPSGIQAANREYAVVRIHNGTATVLTAVASTASSITVETDQFSTYAIVYREKAAATATPAPTVTATAAPTSPATGDGADPVLWTAMLAVCLTGLAVVMLRRKKNER